MESTAITTKFNGVMRRISGDTQDSTVTDLIYALAHEAKQSGRFMMFLVNETEGAERVLSSDDVPYKLLRALDHLGMEARLEVRSVEESEQPWDGGSKCYDADELVSMRNEIDDRVLEMTDEEIQDLIVEQDELLKQQALILLELENQIAEQTDAEFLQLLSQRKNLQIILKQLCTTDWEVMRTQRLDDLNLLRWQFDQLRFQFKTNNRLLEEMRVEECKLRQEVESLRSLGLDY